MTKKTKTVFVHGDFYVLHPGHIRFLKFASSLGDRLIVGVHNSQPIGNFPTPEERVESLHSLNISLESLIISSSLKDFICQLQPDIVLKGKEHQHDENPEAEWLGLWGGSLIFASGESTYFYNDYAKHETKKGWMNSLEKPAAYIKRHNCSSLELQRIIKNFSNINVLVLGDLIIDQYFDCDAIGMSREDPTLVISPVESNYYLGGAGIVASHSARLGAHTEFISVTGGGEVTDVAKQYLSEYKVSANLFIDDSRTAILKQRYRVQGKTMFRVSHLSQHEISREFEKLVTQKVKKLLKDIDVLIFSDFNYGCLTTEMVASLVRYARELNVVIVADSQSSSQLGDILRYSGVNLITPTEYEARLALKDNNSGLQHIANELVEKSRVEGALLTLAENGLLMVTKEADLNSGLRTDMLPAFNSTPVDVSGAGDSMLVAMALSLASGASYYQAAFIGSIASAVQVSRVGNIPLVKNELFDVLNHLG